MRTTMRRLRAIIREELEIPKASCRACDGEGDVADEFRILLDLLEDDA